MISIFVCGALHAQTAQVASISSDSIPKKLMHFNKAFLSFQNTKITEVRRPNSVMFVHQSLKPGAELLARATSFFLSSVTNRRQNDLENYLLNVGLKYAPPMVKQSTLVEDK